MMIFELDLISSNDAVSGVVRKDCEEAGWAVRHHDSIDSFLSESGTTSPPVVILALPEKLTATAGSGAVGSFMEWKSNNSSSQLLLLIPEGVEDTKSLEMELSARHTLHIPYQSTDLARILSRIAQGLGKRRRTEEATRRMSVHGGFEEVIGVSGKMHDVIELAKKVSSSEYTSVMITGENGTGKGALAKAIHGSSDRAQGPFIEVNCAAIPRNLLESEFFGYEKGAFTDAKERKMGLFELANGGTIFLDEIGEIDYNLQAKLLKFLDSRTIRRVSGTQFLPVDVRIISATNRNLKDEVGTKTFRIDLFYRLNVIEINIPPLRERTEDIRPIASSYVRRFSEKLKKKDVHIGEDALELMETYSWPGNIRELINMLERAVLLNTSGTITPDDLPIVRPSREATANIEKHGDILSIDIPPEGIALDSIEKGVITRALEITGGNITRSADLLRVERGTLRYKMKKHGIDAKSFKEKTKNGEYEPQKVSD